MVDVGKRDGHPRPLTPSCSLQGWRVGEEKLCRKHTVLTETEVMVMADERTSEQTMGALLGALASLGFAMVRGDYHVEKREHGSVYTARFQNRQGVMVTVTLSDE